MEAQLTLVFRSAFSWRHRISFSGRIPVGSASTTSSATLRILQQLSIARYIGNFQVEGNTALLCAFKSPGPRSFRSASAISKPSFVRTIISGRLQVSSTNFVSGH